MSLTNSLGISNGTQTLIRKLEVTKKHPQPQLMSSANKKKEKPGGGSGLKPQQHTSGPMAKQQPQYDIKTRYTNANASPPSKASRVSSTILHATKSSPRQ